MPTPRYETLGFVTSAGGQTNEDRAGHAGTLAWVVDGATDVLEERLLPGPSDAGWFAEQLHLDLRACSEAPFSGLDRLLDDVTRRVAGKFEQAARRRPREIFEYPSAAGIVIHRLPDAIEILSLGDCEIITAPSDAELSAPGVDDRLRQRDRGTALAMWAVREEGAATWREARKLLWPRFRAARANLNQPDGYPVFSIIPPPAGMVSIQTIDLPAGSPLLLATDGFMRLVEVFERYTRPQLMAAVLARGVDDLHAELRDLERSDAECTRFPRTKPSDDATALLLVAR